MRTGIPPLVGSLLVILIDLGWVFSGPINWESGLCTSGNIHLSMIAKIKIPNNDGMTPDLMIPDDSSVSCVNGTGADQYKLVVTWSTWDSDPATLPNHLPTTNPSDPVTPKGTTGTQPHEDTTTTKPSTKAEESTQTEKPAENRDSHIDEMIETTTDKSRADEPSSDAIQIEARIGISATPANVSGLNTSGVTMDVRSSSAGVSTSVDVADNNEFTEDSHSQSTTVNDVTTPSELDLPQKSDFAQSKKLLGDSNIAPFLCQYCDTGSEDYTSSSRLPSPEKNLNLLTLIITRREDFFSVSDIYVRFLAPDNSVFYNVFWKNINLFPGPVDATHICENVTKLSFNSQSELLLQNVKLAAYLPDDNCDFPEKTADCSVKYGKDEINADFCRKAEVILIVIGTFLGVLLLGSVIFYATKLYCNARREQEARDALP